MSESGSFLERHHHLFRRLHSLTGVVPIGAFLFVHLATNSSIVWGLLNRNRYESGHPGAATFQHEVNFIHSVPFLLLIEIFGLWLPIAFHAILGLYYATTGSPNHREYGYRDNWRYTLQRVSGYVGVVFIFYHVATLRWGWTFLIPGGTKWEAEFAASRLAMVFQGGADGLTTGGLIMSIFYMVGVSLLVFHLANGLWTAAITWGLTVTQRAQNRWSWICAGIGVALMGMAWSAVIGFVLLDPADAERAERMVNYGHAEQVDESAAPTGSESQSEKGEEQ